MGSLPLWAVFLLTPAVILASLEGGRLLGTIRRRRGSTDQEASGSAMVAATVGLLSIMLAFTFGLAATRFDARRQLLLDEASAIEIAYLRADLLPEPQRGTIRNLFRSYVDIRVKGVDLHRVEEAVLKSGELHGQLWTHAVAAVESDQRPAATSLFVQSLSDVIAFHSRRIAARGIPSMSWIAIYCVAILAMAGLGYEAGLSGRGRPLAIFAVVISYSAILYLITDLNRPEDGLLTVSRQVMVDLRSMMNMPRQ